MNFLKDFGLNPLLLAAQVVNFLVLLFILKRFLYKPVLRVLGERKKKIEESLQHAEEIEKKLQETNVKTDGILAKAQTEGEKIVDEAKEQANQIVENAKIAAENVSSKMLADARAQIQVEKENMRWELQKELSGLVMLVLQKVTGKILNQKSQRQLIEKTVREFKS